jgi:chemotaxis protein methyltransferase CheR
VVTYITVCEEGLTTLLDHDNTSAVKFPLLTPGNEVIEEQKQKNPSPFTGADLDDSIYDRIAEILREQQNFHLEGYKVLCIKRRLAARIRIVSSNDPEAYIEQLQKDIREQKQLLAALSIHVSQFFRNGSVFQVLEKQILPELLGKSRYQGSKLRIWSIGCANGEEPYSVALLCQKQQQAEDLLSIVGTDLSPEALTRAKRGFFPAERVQSIPEEMLAEFFVKTEEQYQLVEEIREQVQFFCHDILTDKPFYRVDLILCRNLLIYFSRTQQQQIIELLATALLPGGYLVLGRAETMALACRKLFTCIDPAERIYRRIQVDESGP